MPVRRDHRGPDRGVAALAATQALRLLVWAYRYLISPLIGPRCRYLPTCSEYALEALERHGAWHGSRLTLARLVRCHPWGGSGYDPVPPAARSGHGPLCAALRHDHGCDGLGVVPATPIPEQARASGPSRAVSACET